MSIGLAWRSAAFCLLALAAASRAEGQHVAKSFEQLGVLVERGDTVTITDAAGSRVRGTIADLSASRVTLLVDGRTRTWEPSDVDVIHQRRHGSLATGAKWGVACGTVLGILAAVSTRVEDPSAFFVADVGVWAALGTGIGVGISAATVHEQLIYRNGAPAAAVTLSPIAAAGRAGVLVSLHF
jgi:hypothetical protein